MPALRIAIAICLLSLPAGAIAQTMGISPDGKKGHIHTVVKGDTLWDITQSYLGTPWAWPSVWKENEGILNPHRIYPGDIIWITEGQMRKLTPEEAERFMRAASREAETTAEVAPQPAAPAPVPVVPTPPPAAPKRRPSDPFAELDSSNAAVERYVEVKGIHRHAFITPQEWARGTGAVMGTHRPSYWSSQQQRIIVSVGEGESHVGDAFTIFRVRRRLLHPTDSQLLGYFVEVLGLGEITEIHPEASYLKILTAYSEIQPGDRVIAYDHPSEKIREVFSDASVDGMVVAYQPYRLRSGRRDLVILDQGSENGVVPGRRFDLYRAGREVRDPLTASKILVPDDIFGELFVIKSSARASLALVMEASTELVLGDRFRSQPQ